MPIVQSDPQAEVQITTSVIYYFNIQRKTDHEQQQKEEFLRCLCLVFCVYNMPLFVFSTSGFRSEHCTYALHQTQLYEQ